MPKTLLAATLLLSFVGWPVCAQEADPVPPSPPANDRVHRVIRLQHINTATAVNLIGGRKIRINASDTLGIITLSGSEDLVSGVEATLKALDVPSSAPTSPTTAPTHSVVISVHFLGIDSDHDRPIPPGLEDVVIELRRHFPYASYQLLETFSVRDTTGSKSEISGMLPTSGEHVSRYSFDVHVRGLQNEQGRRLIRLDDLWVRLRIPVPTSNGQFNYEDVGINTNVMVPEGKFVVIGKAGSAGATEGFFVVLKADVVD